MMTPCFSTLGCVDYTLDEILALAAHFGIPALELRGMDGAVKPEQIPALSPDRIAGTAAALAAAVRPVVYGSSIACTDAAREPAKLTAGFGEIDTAAALGFPNVRVFGNRYIDGDEAASVQAAAAVLRELCAYAAPRGITILLEVHGDFVHAETFEALFAALAGVPNFGLIWDVAHSDGPYGDGWLPFWRTIAPYTRHVHIKDHRRAAAGSPKKLTQLGEGEIPLVPILRQLAADGYDGCVSLEWERKWHPELPPIEAALERFCAILAEAGVGHSD